MKVLYVDNCMVGMAFCHLRCPYCVHITAEYKDILPEEVANKLENCNHVYIGGAEPTVQKNDLVKLLELLKDKDVTLKTDGMMPEVIEDTLKYVSKFVFELKADFSDIEVISKLTGLPEKRARKYAENLLKSIEIARNNGKKIRLWVRVIPEYIKEDSLENALRKTGRVDEILLYQFLSRDDWDRPFDNASKPDFDYVLKMGKIAWKFSEKAIVVGEKRVVL